MHTWLPEQYTVQYGNTITSPNGSNVVGVAEVIRHEDYNSALSYINDIGIMRLKEPVKMISFRSQVRLAAAGSVFPTGTPAVLTGWGFNGTGGVLLTHLQRADLEVVSSVDCNAIHVNDIHNTNICALFPGGGRGQCSGNSGK